MNMDFGKIQYFLKVAETKNFSRAARELFISPQALNKQIIKLEEELDEKLFVRSTRTVELTEFGKVVHTQFSEVMRKYAEACREVSAYKEQQKNKLKIGFFQAIPKKTVIYPVVQYLQAEDPKLQVEMFGGELDEVNDWLMSGTVDVVLTNTHQYEQWPGMKLVYFKRMPAKIIVSLYHPWVVKEKVTAEDMAKYPILLYERTKVLEPDSFYRNVCSNGRHFAPNFSSLLANLESGEHYAVFPKMFDSMQWDGYKYFDLPDEYRFEYATVAMYPKDSRFKGKLKVLDTMAEENVLNI